MQIEAIAKELDIFIVSGVIEKEGGTLYCSVAFFSPSEGLVYSRRKVSAANLPSIVTGRPDESFSFLSWLRACLQLIAHANSWRKIDLGFRN